MGARLSNVEPWKRGIYTIPDASHILRLPAARLRDWVTGSEVEGVRYYPAGTLESKGKGADKNVSFLTLIELFTISQLRGHGLAMGTLRSVREELSQRFHTDYPFALEGLLISGKRLLKEIGDEALLELGTKGQTAFAQMITPFCHRLDFDAATKFAARYFPMGKSAGVVVDPRHAFGRPTIVGTNLTTETICSMIRGGDHPEDIAEAFQVSADHVNAARTFEMKASAA